MDGAGRTVVNLTPNPHHWRAGELVYALSMHFCDAIKSEGARAGGRGENGKTGKPGAYGSAGILAATGAPPRAPAFRSTVPSRTTASMSARPLMTRAGSGSEMRRRRRLGCARRWEKENRVRTCRRLSLPFFGRAPAHPSGRLFTIYWQSSRTDTHAIRLVDRVGCMHLRAGRLEGVPLKGHHLAFGRLGLAPRPLVPGAIPQPITD